MLKIDLLFYFLELQDSFSETLSKKFRDRNKLTIGKDYFSKTIQNVFSSESSILSEVKKSSFFLGKTFQYHYCESKILENRFNLSIHSIKSHILVGSFYQSTGSLILAQILDRIFYLNRKQFFNLEIPRYLIKNSRSFNKTGQRFMFRNGLGIIGLENPVLFNDSNSKINLGLIERIYNIKLDNSKECEVYFKKKQTSGFYLSQFFRNYNTIKLRRYRIFSLQNELIFPKKLKNKYISKYKNFQKGLFCSLSSTRYFLSSNFCLANNLIFFLGEIKTEIHKGLLDWVLQLKTEHYSQIQCVLPFSMYFCVNDLSLSQVIQVLGSFLGSCNKNTRLNFSHDLTGVSLLKSDLDWNVSFTVSELSMDFSLQLFHLGFCRCLFTELKWKSLLRIILFYFLSNPKNTHYLEWCKNNNRFECTFFKKSEFKYSFDKGWVNEIFDDVKFFKKKTRPYFGLNSKRDINQKNKLFLFLSMKTFW
jgi:hypothetical protein